MRRVSRRFIHTKVVHLFILSKFYPKKNARKVSQLAGLNKPQKTKWSTNIIFIPIKTKCAPTFGGAPVIISWKVCCKVSQKVLFAQNCTFPPAQKEPACWYAPQIAFAARRNNPGRFPMPKSQNPYPRRQCGMSLCCSPQPLLFYSLNARPGHTKTICYFLLWNADCKKLLYLAHFIGIQFCLPVFFAWIVYKSGSKSMFHIIFMCHPLKVFEVVICFVPVNVVYVWQLAWVRNKA